MGAWWSAITETVSQERAHDGKFFTAQIRSGVFKNLFLTAHIQSDPEKVKSEEIPVTLEEASCSSKNQLWYFDPINSAIRQYLKQHEGFCLDVRKDGALVLRMFRGANSQRWSIHEDFIQQLDSPKVVVSAASTRESPNSLALGGLCMKMNDLDIKDTKMNNFDIKDTKKNFNPPVTPNTGPQLRCVEEGSTTEKLSWEFTHRKAQSFFITSSTGYGVLDVREGLRQPQTEVIIYPKWKDFRKNQIWYEDTTGCIRSRVGDGTMILSSEKGKMFINESNAEKMPRYAIECTTSREKRIRKVDQGENTVVFAVEECLGMMGKKWTHMARCRHSDDADGRKAELWEIEYYDDGP